MQIKSSGLPQGSAFSDLKNLLDILANPKVSKQTLEDLTSDIAQFQELYKINTEQLEEIEKQKIELSEGFEKLKSENEKFELKQNDYFSAVSDLEAKNLKLAEDKKEFAKDKKTSASQYALDVENLKNSQAVSDKKFDDAVISLNKSDALIAEYEAKLSRMKEMVG